MGSPKRDRDQSNTNFLRKLWKILASDLASIIGAIVAGVAGIVVVLVNRPVTPITNPNLIPAFSTDIPLISTQVWDLSTQVSSIDQSIGAISQLPTGVAVELQFTRLQTSIDEINTNLTSLEDAILDNPAKALELPLLSRDIDSLAEKQQADVARIEANIIQFVDLFKWLIGLIGASIIGLAISNIFTNRAKQEEKKE